MSEIRITPEEMRYISLFQDFTGATVIDCIVDNEYDRLIFLVKPSEVGLAVGRGGSNLKRLRKLLGKQIEVVAYSDKLEELVKNIFRPAIVKSVRVVKGPRGKRVIVTVDPSTKGLAIGKGGKNIAKARLILKRHFGIDDIVVVG